MPTTTLTHEEMIRTLKEFQPLAAIVVDKTNGKVGMITMVEGCPELAADILHVALAYAARQMECSVEEVLTVVKAAARDVDDETMH